MADWRVAVAPVDADRYCFMLIDVRAAALRGPDGGDDNLGYSAEQLRNVARDRYGLSNREIETRIAAADHKRAQDVWRSAHAEMLRRRPTGSCVSSEELARWSDLCSAEQNARASMDAAAARLSERDA